MSVLFVAGAGTEIGKTAVSERLLRRARREGRRVRALKPVASGVGAINDAAFSDSDAARLLRAAGEPIEPATVDRCAPWRFAAPLSPDWAAAAEGRALPFAHLARWLRDELAQRPAPDLLLIEGVGGVMSPICDDATNLDLIQALGAPTVLVAGSYLGAISHALTAVEALRARGAGLRGLVVNESVNSVGLRETCASLARFAPGLPIAALRRGEAEAPDALYALATGAPEGGR